MQANNWAPEHSAALREFLAGGMSFSAIAEALNQKFGTSYTRSAAISRSKRMGLAGPDQAVRRLERALNAKPGRPKRPGKAGKAGEARDVRVREAPAPESSRPPTEPVKLRCVGISPRLVSLIELKPGDCRYPYGGDREGEPIVFCGHPRREGSSYCTPHFHLTQAPAAETERPAARVLLRLVEAA
jgi:GcrA cell cycle regulator